MRKSIMMILCAAMTVLFFSSVPCSALVALPQDAGIDYRTMRVADPSKLKAKGMKTAQIGDMVTLGPLDAGGLPIINKRTGEKIKWNYTK